MAQMLVLAKQNVRLVFGHDVSRSVQQRSYEIAKSYLL